MKTSIPVATLKDFAAAATAALDLLDAAARISDGDVYNDLFNAREDARYLVAKAERRKYDPQYREVGE